MRHIARYSTGEYSMAELPAPEISTTGGFYYPPVEYAGPEAKVDLAILLPGGMTQDAEPGISRLHASSPEPVIGYGGTKGIFAYYRAVLHFGTLAE